MATEDANHKVKNAIWKKYSKQSSNGLPVYIDQ
jgi:hypothetical protein